ncbi:MAG: hypothetical protein ACREMX_16995, partial [Gemmatimonadales bacterium]
GPDTPAPLSAPPLVEAPLSPMTTTTFAYFHGWYDDEAFKNTGKIFPLFRTTMTRRLETGSYFQGKWYPDTEEVPAEGLRLESTRIEAEYEFRGGLWSQVSGKPEEQLWQEREQKVQELERSKPKPADAPLAGPSLDDLLLMDYILNFDREYRSASSPPSATSLLAAKLPSAARAWSFILDPGLEGSAHYLGLQAGPLGLALGNPTQNLPYQGTGAIRWLEPGVGVGYSYIQRGQATTSSFSLGVSPSSELVPYYAGGRSQPQPFTGPSAGWYFGLKFSRTW